MEKVLFATYDGKNLKTDESLDLPLDTRVKVIIESEENDAENGNKGTKSVDTQQQNNNELIRLLQLWREEGNEEEQQETWKYLKRVLDEDRLSDRRLFP